MRIPSTNRAPPSNADHLETPPFRLWESIRRHPFVTFCLVLVLIIKLLFVAWDWVRTPTINPHPKDPITFRGAFPFAKGYDLVFMHSAKTTTKWMNSICNRGGFESANIKCASGRTVVHATNIDGKNYEITLYRDHYLPGIGGWYHTGFAFSALQTPDPQPSSSGGLSFNTEVYCDDDAMTTKGRKSTHLFCMDRNAISFPHRYVHAPVERHYIDPQVRVRNVNIRLESEITHLQIME